jgi:hypothetical protein
VVVVDVLTDPKDVNDCKSNAPFCMALHMTFQNIVIPLLQPLEEFKNDVLTTISTL